MLADLKTSFTGSSLPAELPVPAAEGVCVAAWRSDLKVLEGLVEHELRAAGQQLHPCGFGPLHFAAALRNAEVLALLLDRRLDPNARDRDGNTPLHWLLAYPDADDDLLELLLDAGALLDAQNYRGETPLFLAAARDLPNRLEFLLDNGADPSLADIDGATPLHHAAAHGHLAAVELLLRFGAHLNAADHEGDTPLHWSVRECRDDVVRALLTAGADSHVLNDDAESPIDQAASCEDHQMVRLLISLAPSKPPLVPPPLAACFSPLDRDVQQVQHDLKTLRMEDEAIGSRPPIVAFGTPLFGTMY